LFRLVLSQVLVPADGRCRRKISVLVDTYCIHVATPVLAMFSAHPEQIELVTRPASAQSRPAVLEAGARQSHSPDRFPDH
jgi:hypothetical protein